MAAVTLLGSTFTTTAGSKSVTATPAIDDLIVIVTAHTGYSASTAPTDDKGGTYALLETTTKNAGADRLDVWARHGPFPVASSTVFTHNAAGSTGGGLVVLKVTGMGKFGAAAKVKSGKQTNVTATGTPSVSMGSAISTNNPVVGAVFSSTNSTATAAHNASYTERFDNGYATPTTGLEVMTRDSGETGSSVSWGGSATQPFGSIVVELDTSTYSVSGSVSDDFDDASIGSEWTAGKLIYPGTAQSETTLSESSGVGRTSTAAAAFAGTGQAWGFVTTTKRAFAAGGREFIRLPSRSVMGNSGFIFTVRNGSSSASADDGIWAFCDFNTLQHGRTVGGGTGTSSTSASYNSANHGWLSHRYDSSTNAWILETAPASEDPPTTWTSFGSISIASFPSLANAKVANVALEFGAYGATSVTEVITFDGYNTATTSAVGYTLTAASGSLTLTGTAATLKVARRLSAAAASYALTGASTGLNKGYKLTAGGGSFTLTGAAASLPVARKLTAVSGLFALTGVAATFRRAYTLTASAGAYSVTGTAAGLYRGLKLTVAAGSYALTGTATGLRATRLLTATSGAFALTGTSAALQKGFTLTGGAGTYALTGAAADLRAARALSGAAGAYTLTGTAAGLRKGAALAAGAGAYALTGTAATFAFTRRLEGTAGTFALTGVAAGLYRGARLPADSGSFAVTGADVSLLFGRRLASAAGAYALTGTSAGLYHGRNLAAVAGTFTLTGVAATLRRTGRLTAAAGGYTLTGVAATLTKPSAFETIAAAAGSFALTGGVAALKKGFRLGAVAGAYTVTGAAATFLLTRRLDAQAGAFALSGVSAGLYRGFTLEAGSGAFALTGFDATFNTLRRLAAEAGTFTYTGSVAMFRGRPPTYSRPAPAMAARLASNPTYRHPAVSAARPAQRSSARPAAASTGRR